MKIFKISKELFPELKFLKKILLILIVLFLSTGSALLLWDHILLPINDINNYGSEYFIKSYNKNNDTLRFIVFVLISIAPFLFLYRYLFKDKILTIKEFLNLEPTSKIKKYKLLNYTFFLFLFLCFLEYFLIDLNFFSSNLDFFHEGLWLTPSFNYHVTGDLWKGSYVGRGLFGNFYSIIAWNFFDNISIGSVRILNTFMLLINKLLLIVLAKQISENINFSIIKKMFFFILLSLFFVSLVDYYNKEEFVKRSPLIILFLNFLILSIKDSNRFSFYFFILGSFSFISLIWFIDVGAYINFILLCLLIFYLIKLQFKILSSLLVGVISGWLFLMGILPSDELKEFFSNTTNIYKTIDQIHGLIYPAPFSDNSRGLKTLLFFVVGGIFSIFICLDKNKFNNNNKIFFLFLFILALVSFKTGLSRSDSGHIRTATGPLMIVLYSYSIYWIIDNLNLDKFNKISNKNSLILNFLILIIILINFKVYNIKNIISYKSNLNTLVKATDEDFLKNENNRYIGLINYYKKISKSDQCLQILTEETALPYLLKKKSCTKYFSAWYISPPYIQIDYINNLKEAKPRIILFSNREIRFMPKFDQVINYIEKNYKFHSKYENWTFVQIKK